LRARMARLSLCSPPLPIPRSADLQPFRKRPPHIHKTLSYRVQFYTFFRIFSTIRAHPLLVPPVKSPDSHSDDIILQPVCFFFGRSEEHTSELQSRFDLVCRLLLAQ